MLGMFLWCNRFISLAMKTAIFCYLLLFSVKGQVLNFIDEDPESLRDSAIVTQDWEHVENLLKNFVKDGLKSLIPSLTGGMNNLNVSSSCVRDTVKLLGGIQKLKTWAMRFFDSTGKGMVGVMHGTFFDWGAYDECVNTVAYNQRSGKTKGEVMFTGKYCMLHIRPHLPKVKVTYKIGEVIKELQAIHKKGTIISELARYAPMFYYIPFRLGLCIPSGCSPDDLNGIFSKASDYMKLHMKVKRCEVKEKPNFTPVKIFVMSLYSFAGFLVLLGTLTDMYYHYYAKVTPTRTSARAILAFSFISNFQNLLNTSTSSQSLRCLNGLRVLTMAWVILQHSYLLSLFQIVDSFIDTRSMIQEFAFQVVLLPAVAVDTFYFLGGFLVCYFTTQHVVIRKGTLSILLYIFHRIWRILPALIFVVLYMFIADITASGPIAHDAFMPFIEGCQANWWATLLFINNFYKPENPCLTHSWYLSLDLQLHIAALLILIPLFRWPKLGIGIAVGTIAVFTAVSGIVVYLKNLPPAFILNDFEPVMWSRYLTEFYFKPYSHIGPYLIGILSGYFLVMNPDLKIPKKIQFIGWCCSIIFAISPLYGTYEWNNGRSPTVVETIFYASFHRIGWTLNIAWIVFCCTTGHGGVVNYVLSWKVWIPLGRLTYMAYLVHFIVLISFIAASRQTVGLTHTVGVWLFFGHLVVTYGISLAGAMLIESPFMALKKLFLPQRDKKNTKEKESNYAAEVLRKGKICYGKNNRSSTVSAVGNTEMSNVGNGIFVCRL